MTTREPQPRRDDLIESYLDGQLSEAERASFEAKVAESAELRAQLELQRRVDAALGRLFGESSEAAPVLPMPRRWRVHPALVALAAVVCMATVGVWWFATRSFVDQPDRLGPLYRQTIAAGFTPEVVCTTPDEFAGWVRSNFGQPLHPSADPGIEYVGWSYAHIVSGYSGVLLARVDGQPVIVAMDRIDREYARQVGPRDASLTMHRRRIGNLVLYEVTPLGRARILPALSERQR